MNFDPEFFNALTQRAANVPWWRILFITIISVGGFSFGWWMMGLVLAWART